MLFIVNIIYRRVNFTSEVKHIFHCHGVHGRLVTEQRVQEESCARRTFLAWSDCSGTCLKSRKQIHMCDHFESRHDDWFFRELSTFDGGIAESTEACKDGGVHEEATVS